MSTLRAIPGDPDEEPGQGRRNLLQMPVTNMAEPMPPAVEVRRSGLLGLFPNTKDLAHGERLRDEWYLQVEITSGMEQATYADIKNIRTVRDGALAAQHILDTTPNIPFPVQLVQALGGRFGSRSLQRFDRAGEVMDELQDKILRRGR
jgi:hypothetical protein